MLYHLKKSLKKKHEQSCHINVGTNCAINMQYQSEQLKAILVRKS